jgi:DEAD/DEAH box helicase domain-containing protein
MRTVVFDIETIHDGSAFYMPELDKLEVTVVGVYDSETDSYSCFTRDELSQLWPILEKTDVLVGYNSDHFDIPILNRYYPGELGHIKSIDLLKEIKNSVGRRFKLDNIAQSTLGYGKSGDGMQAFDWWRNGDYEKVKKYCLDDVKITKEIYDYALKNHTLKYTDFGGQVQEFKIKTSDWKKKEAAAMTHTLPF